MLHSPARKPIQWFKASLCELCYCLEARLAFSVDCLWKIGFHLQIIDLPVYIDVTPPPNFQTIPTCD